MQRITNNYGQVEYKELKNTFSEILNNFFHHECILSSATEVVKNDLVSLLEGNVQSSVRAAAWDCVGLWDHADDRGAPLLLEVPNAAAKEEERLQ